MKSVIQSDKNLRTNLFGLLRIIPSVYIRRQESLFGRSTGYVAISDGAFAHVATRDCFEET